MDVTTFYETEEFIKTEMEKFNSYLRLFTGEPEAEELKDKEVLDSTFLNSEGS